MAKIIFVSTLAQCKKYYLRPMNALNGVKFLFLTAWDTTPQKIQMKQKCYHLLFLNIRIIERILPRLSHINPTVVFSAVKVILKYLDSLDNGELVKNLCKKLAPSLSIRIIRIILFSFPHSTTD